MRFGEDLNKDRLDTLKKDVSFLDVEKAILTSALESDYLSKNKEIFNILLTSNTFNQPFVFDVEYTKVSKLINECNLNLNLGDFIGALSEIDDVKYSFFVLCIKAKYAKCKGFVFAKILELVDSVSYLEEELS